MEKTDLLRLLKNAELIDLLIKEKDPTDIAAIRFELASDRRRDDSIFKIITDRLDKPWLKTIRDKDQWFSGLFDESDIQRAILNSVLWKVGDTHISDQVIQSDIAGRTAAIHFIREVETYMPEYVGIAAQAMARNVGELARTYLGDYVFEHQNWPKVVAALLDHLDVITDIQSIEKNPAFAKSVHDTLVKLDEQISARTERMSRHEGSRQQPLALLQKIQNKPAPVLHRQRLEVERSAWESGQTFQEKLKTFALAKEEVTLPQVTALLDECVATHKNLQEHANENYASSFKYNSEKPLAQILRNFVAAKVAAGTVSEEAFEGAATEVATLLGHLQSMPLYPTLWNTAVVQKIHTRTIRDIAYWAKWNGKITQALKAA